MKGIPQNIRTITNAIKHCIVPMQTMAEQVQKLDSFRLLLNEISHQLTEQNLQSLIHIYNVPGGMRKQISDGLELFNYMMTQDYISREKIGNLRNLMRKVRPRRKDLVRLVDDHIKQEFKTDDVRFVLDDFSESWEQIPKSGSSPPDEPEAVFKIDCSYLNCVCRRVPSCYAPIIVLLFWLLLQQQYFGMQMCQESTPPSLQTKICTMQAGIFCYQRFWQS